MLKDSTELAKGKNNSGEGGIMRKDGKVLCEREKQTEKVKESA